MEALLVASEALPVFLLTKEVIPTRKSILNHDQDSLNNKE